MASLYKYFLLISFSLCYLSCDKNSEIDINNYNETIIGKWQYTGAYISAGGPQYWISIENGNTIEFSNDGTFSSNNFTACTIGNYYIEDKKLILEYTCDDFVTEAMNEDKLITYNIKSFESTSLILTSTSGPICTEGCSSKYEKI